MTHTARQRGSVYLAVLGASMLVTILGVSALLTVRLQREASTLDQDAAQAAFVARSAVEVAMRQMQNTSNWRSTYTHNTWSSEITVGDVRYAWKFASTTGNSLAGFPNDPVRVYGRGVVGDAVRIESVLMRPIDLKGTAVGTNILDDPGFSAGNTSAWGIVGNVVSIALDVLSGRLGLGALTVKNRNTTNDGAFQDVTTKLVNGMTYETSVWGKSPALTTNNLVIRLIVTSTGSGTQTYTSPAKAINSLTWQQATGTFTPRWTGQLVSARWEVIATSNTSNFTIDDAYLGITATSPRPHLMDTSSWRQELP